MAHEPTRCKRCNRPRQIGFFIQVCRECHREILMTVVINPDFRLNPAWVHPEMVGPDGDVVSVEEILLKAFSLAEDAREHYIRRTTETN